MAHANTPRRWDILAVGEILAEVMAEQTDQSLARPGRLLGPYPSGAPAIAIDQAAKLGARAALVARVGEDDFGRLNLERLAGDGVDTSRILPTPGSTTGVAFVTYFSGGDRRFIFHFRHAACGRLGPADIDPADVADARWLHIMGCSVSGSPSLGRGIMKAVRAAAACGTRISFDPNIRPELLRGSTLAAYREILVACDLVMAGRGELERLWGGEAPAAVAGLLAGKDRTVVVRDGLRGTRAYTRRAALQAGLFEAREVDPTGAGDCFDAAFLTLLSRGEPLERCLLWASAAGARAVEARGPMEGTSTTAELTAFMAARPAPAIVAVDNPYAPEEAGHAPA